MKVELKPGEKVEIGFHESDGIIAVEFNEADVKVTADMPDSSGREGVIYHEEFIKDSIKEVELEQHSEDVGHIQAPVMNLQWTEINPTLVHAHYPEMDPIIVQQSAITGIWRAYYQDRWLCSYQDLRTVKNVVQAQFDRGELQ